MPLALLLLIIGIGLICLSLYVVAPPFKGWCMGGGVFCVAVAIIIVIYTLLLGGGVKLA